MDIIIKNKGCYDVIVVGGGIAGISASVAAAREGRKVLLVEKGVNLGGLATVGLISWYEPLCDGCGNKVIGGIAEELIHLAVDCGFDNLAAHWGGRGKNPPSRHGRYASFFSPGFFSLALDKYVMDNGVKLLFDTLATYPVMDGGHCLGIIAETVEGRDFYSADIVIDATGSATVMHRAGVPCKLGNNFMTYIVHDMDHESAKKYVDDKNLAKFRRWKICGSAGDGRGHPNNMKLFRCESAEDVTEYMLKGKELILSRYEGIDKDDREILSIPYMPQFRTIRHICGESSFEGDEGITGLADCIGRVPDFRFDQKVYELPYSSLYHRGFDNLLAAGRIISIKDPNAWEVVRVIPVCAFTGEAAGIAASLALDGRTSVANIDVTALKNKLDSRR